MAMAVDLDPAGYPGTYKMIGGRAALDLANLVSYRGTPREHDWLVPAANVRRWVDAAGLSSTRRVDRRSLVDLRELLARVFLAVADGDTPSPADVDRLGTLATRAAARRRLHFPEGADCAEWTDARPSLVGRLALDATEILTSPKTLRRVAACDECRWLFVDTTRNHSRRWCDPADCGNRARQRRHYRRTRPSADASSGSA